MPKDAPKGANQWIGGRGVGTDPDQAARIAEVAKEVEEDQPRPRGEREKIAVNRNAAYVRSMLKNHSADVIRVTSGRELHPDDAAELAASLDKEIAALPARFRDRVKEAGKQVREFISEGQRQDAWTLADNTATKIGAELPPSWTPPAEDNSDIDAIIADVPR